MCVETVRNFQSVPRRVWFYIVQTQQRQRDKHLNQWQSEREKKVAAANAFVQIKTNTEITNQKKFVEWTVAGSAESEREQ